MSERLLNQVRRSPHQMAPFRSVQCPCEGRDPFCDTCVPCARHLNPDIQRRRWDCWKAQESLLRRVEKYRRKHAGEKLPDAFPDLAERRSAAGMSPGMLAAKAGIGVRQLLRSEAEPTQRLEPSVVLRLRLALGIVREESGSPQDSL